MVDSEKLLSDLQNFVKGLEDDLRVRCEEHPEVDQPLRAAYDAAKNKRRTALTYAAWRDEELTQVAVAWVLACVFIRFLEDNELIETPTLAGPGMRLQRAKDEHEMFFRENPTLTEREYFEKVFNDVGALPGMKEFFDRKHNPLWQVAPTGDAARNLLDFWRRTDPETGALTHDFTDPEWKTRFLGDLYQDLSESARKRYALLQTPVFIEQFILDHTLTPAIETFGWQIVRMIDPTCGSGHFLLGGFDRLFRLWQEHRPGENPRVLAQRALDQVFGVDLNPNVVAIARFRLLLAALRASGIHRLYHAPDFKIHIAAGDALLHGRRFRDFEGTATERTFDTEQIFRDELKHHYEAEDVDALHRILGQQYHAVVGNPPYITVKDRALNQLYRARYLSCHRKYSLAVPFMERFFDLAIKGDGTAQHPAGFVGQITANSFMKREFGKKLVEKCIPRWDVTHVLDTSGAYIPGHGTPTVIVFGRNQPPVSSTIRTVLGIRGEPVTPDDPAHGLVWQAICHQIDQPGSQSEWVSAGDSPRANFHQHPWSIGGGGVAELKETLDEVGERTLADVIEVAGFGCVIGEDEVFTAPLGSSHFQRLPADLRRMLVEGDVIRDWQLSIESEAIFPYSSSIELRSDTVLLNWLWPLRTHLKARKDFGKVTYAEAGRPYWEYHQIPTERNKAKLLVVFAEVASHNHFVLNRSAKVFKQTAPIMKLPNGATERDHLALVGLLNSSTFCFLMKQVAHQKQMTGGDGVRVDSRAKVPYQFASTQILKLVIPDAFFSGELRDRLTNLASRMDTLATELEDLTAEKLLRRILESGIDPQTAWNSTLVRRQEIRSRLIALQEQIDFTVYQMFGIADTSLQGSEIDDVLFEAEAGVRPFEIIGGQNIDGFPGRSNVPTEWPEAVRRVWAHRIAGIRKSKSLELIEDPHYKRRWIGRQGLFNLVRRSDEMEIAARNWLLTRLEGYFHESSRARDLKDGFDPEQHGFSGAAGPHLVSTNELAEVVENDRAFLEVAAVYHGSSGFSVPRLVRELIEDESVPYLPLQRYKESGLRARKDWEVIWELQRKEDTIEAEVRKQHPRESEEGLKALIRKAQQEEIGDIPVPPKYSSKDFQKSSFWRLRGKLDVPKERWISYPGAERDGDLSPVIAWAGWDHLQQAQALAEFYLDAKTNQGWPATKLKSLLAGLFDLLPWLKQWHNEIDPEYGMGLGDYFGGFLQEECRTLGLTLDDVNAARFDVTPLHEPEEALT